MPSKPTKPKPLKVYGTSAVVRGATRSPNGDPFRRVIVVAKSQREAAELMGVKLNDFRFFGCQTGNEKEIQIATANVGKAMWFDQFGDKQWHVLEKR